MLLLLEVLHVETSSRALWDTWLPIDPIILYANREHLLNINTKGKNISIFYISINSIQPLIWFELAWQRTSNWFDLIWFVINSSQFGLDGKIYWHPWSKDYCFPQPPKFLLALMCFSFIREPLFLLAISPSCTSTKASCICELVADKRLAYLRTLRRLFLENYSSIRQETRASSNLVFWHTQGGTTCCTGCVCNRVDEERSACC